MLISSWPSHGFKHSIMTSNYSVSPVSATKSVIIWLTTLHVPHLFTKVAWSLRLVHKFGLSNWDYHRYGEDWLWWNTNFNPFPCWGPLAAICKHILSSKLCMNFMDFYRIPHGFPGSFPSLSCGVPWSFPVPPSITFAVHTALQPWLPGHWDFGCFRTECRDCLHIR